MKLQEVFAKKTYRNRLRTVTDDIAARKISVAYKDEILWTDTKALEDYLANLIISQNARPPDRACYFIYEGLFRDMRRADMIDRRYRHRWNQDERRQRIESWFAGLLEKKSDDSLLHYDAENEEDHNLIITIRSQFRELGK